MASTHTFIIIIRVIDLAWMTVINKQCRQRCKIHFGWPTILHPHTHPLLFNCTNKQSDSDPIPTWLLKVCVSSVLTPAITNFVNLSLSSGQFHPILKESIHIYNHICVYKTLTKRNEKR